MLIHAFVIKLYVMEIRIIDADFPDKAVVCAAFRTVAAFFR